MPEIEKWGMKAYFQHVLYEVYRQAIMPKSHYEAGSNRFTLYASPNEPQWHLPQFGALNAVCSHWVLNEHEPALVSMPTGSGKTAVALALPYLSRSHRVLVVVPSKELRTQIASSFKTEGVLHSIGALEGKKRPKVYELKGRAPAWNEIEKMDVVVALPNSVSPIHFKIGESPPEDFFDLIIIDEAHHAPATTWKAILDYFKTSKAVLLTATPRRRDGKTLPGTHVFHYPLRKAMKDGIYKPIVPIMVKLQENPSQQHKDETIAKETVRLAATSDHAQSAVLIRASSIERANQLKTIYDTFGLNSEVIHSKIPNATRDNVIKNWREGRLKAVIVVDMLGEGIDLPSLRIVAYHDKHKSVQATIQLIGRLARVNQSHPQPSILVTARDEDVYPSLVGVVRSLYEEDADWAKVLPDLIDQEIEEERLNQEYLGKFLGVPSNIALSAVTPLARAVIYEAIQDSGYIPSFVSGGIPEELVIGNRIGGQAILYSGVNEDKTTLIILSVKLETPRWYQSDPGLTSPAYQLHVLSWHKASRIGWPDILLVNSEDSRISKEILGILDEGKLLRGGNPVALQAVFDSLERLSVSSVGVRNTYAGSAGTPTYAMFSGSGVDRGLREADTNSRAIGHAMAQVQRDSGTATVGFAAAKSKYWETRYLSLRDYENFVRGLADRYWDPRDSTTGPLLPNVARGIRTETFSSSGVVLVEVNPRLVEQGWRYHNHGDIEGLSLEVDHSIPFDNYRLFLKLVDPRQSNLSIWEGTQDISGRFTTTLENDQPRRGFGSPTSIEHLFESDPPNIYFLDGHTVHGGTTYLPVATQNFLPVLTYDPWDWTGTDITRETKVPLRTDSIHDRVENHLSTSVNGKRFRWVLCNDGPGEMADHIVIQIDRFGRTEVELWHAKASGTPTPATRVTDLQILVQQGIKSRRYLTDRDLWKKIGRRLEGLESPKMRLVSGNSENLLRVLCGLVPHHSRWSLADRMRKIDGSIVLVQPGLSYTQLQNSLNTFPIPVASGQIREFLTVFDNSVQSMAKLKVICSP